MAVAMTCADAAEAIQASIDGTIDAAARVSLDRHLDGCASCRLALDDLRRIRDAAGALERRAPPDGLWPQIASRLQTDSQRTSAAVPLADRVRRFATTGTAGWWLAAAATLALAVTLWVLVPRPATDGPAPRAATSAPADTPAAGANAAVVDSIENELRLAEQHYERAIANLERIAKAEDSALDPQVAETLQKSLRVIDQAIAESRSALRAQPESQLAQESLFESLRRKVGLLQDTIALINEMRKGNPTEAAKLVEGLNKS